MTMISRLQLINIGCNTDMGMVASRPDVPSRIEPINSILIIIGGLKVLIIIGGLTFYHVIFKTNKGTQYLA